MSDRKGPSNRAMRKKIYVAERNLRRRYAAWLYKGGPYEPLEESLLQFTQLLRLALPDPPQRKKKRSKP